MLHIRTVFLVGLVGMSASAFSATPDQATTREDRMASALKDYEGGKKASVATAPPGDVPAHMTAHMTAHHRSAEHLRSKHATNRKN